MASEALPVRIGMLRVTSEYHIKKEYVLIGWKDELSVTEGEYEVTAIFDDTEANNVAPAHWVILKLPAKIVSSSLDAVFEEMYLSPKSRKEAPPINISLQYYGYEIAKQIMMGENALDGAGIWTLDPEYTIVSAEIEVAPGVIEQSYEIVLLASLSAV